MTRSSALLAALVLVGCATTKPQVKPVAAQPAPKKDADDMTPSAADMKAAQKEEAAPQSADFTPSKEAQAQAAAELRTTEEKELAAKEEKEQKDLAKEKANEVKLDAEFDDAFKAAKAGKDDVAIGVYQRAVDEIPESWAGHYNLGVLYERTGKAQEAMAEYEKALERKNDYVQASENLTRMLLRAHQEQRAEGELRKRILSFPRNLAFRNQLVSVMIQEGREDQAENESKKVLKVDERNIGAMLNLATIWFGQKKYELAKQVLDNAKEIDPNEPAVWNLLAFCQLALEQKPLALESFKKAAELREDFPEAHNNYGAMLNEVNDCDGATHELELAVRYAPDSAKAHLNLGNAYRCSRRYTDAQTQYKKAQELETGLTDPDFNLAILYLDSDMPDSAGKTLEKLPRLQTSLAYFQKYRDEGGNDPRYDRYLDEARKAIEKEEARIERVKQQEVRKKDKEAKEAEKKRVADEKAKADAAKKRQYVESMKVAGKSDLEDDKAPAPSPAEPPPVAKPPVTSRTPPEKASPASSGRPRPRLEKIGGKEE